MLAGSAFEDGFIFVPEIAQLDLLPAKLCTNVFLPFVSFLWLSYSRLEHQVEFLALNSQRLL
jgi:hypothetical protein